MTLTFFSNFLNHHQLPLCLALRGALGRGFRFVATTPFIAEAVSKGYRDMNLDYDFCLPAYLDEQSANAALRLGAESDVVLSGGVEDRWIAPRLAKNKLSFRVSERPLKPLYARLDGRTAAAMWWRNTRYQRRNLYLLACGAHTLGDFQRVGAYRSKAYRWGYFPPVPQLFARARGEGEPLSLAWAGRMISWKHPEMPLRLASALRDSGMPFRLTYVGEGELLEETRAAACSMGLGEAVCFAGAMSPAAVREEMLASDIFLFTSDENEGWGAVLNEAMASGCAVVASAPAGATGYLVRHGENGLVYNGSVGGLVEAGMQLAAQPPLRREELGVAAYDTMRRLWNGDVAARRLLELCEGLLAGLPPLYAEGPCSPAWLG